jgi:YD repeat-containing protein
VAVTWEEGCCTYPGSLGQSVTYGYDGNGDIISVTDIADYIMRFEYDENHFLTDITDPRGIKISRNIYDDSGRLIAVIDANGNRMDFNFALQ